jgi:predicted nucleic acid-binding protein
VTRWLLETNILGDLVKPEPSPALVAWMAERRDEDLYISALTIAEIRRGILDLPSGRRRDQLEAWFSGPEGPPALFAGRTLGFDERAAPVWARLMAEGRAAGRPRSALDTVIAATAEANGCVVVTGNEADFAGVEVVNPMGAG